MKYAFWGLGKIGEVVFEFHKILCKLPDYVIDSDINRWGLAWHGMKISGPEILNDVKDEITVCITCKDEGDYIFSELRNVQTSNIIIKKYNDIQDVLGELLSDDRCLKTTLIACKRVLFDLENGDILGGAENWTRDTTRLLGKCGYVTDSFGLPNKPSYEKIRYATSVIANAFPCNIVVSFGSYNFYAACIQKYLHPSEIRLIAIVHNDRPYYYDTYSKFAELIDCCFVISSRMLNEMKCRHFPEDRLRKLNWYIPVKEPYLRCENDVIHIGYAGRLVRNQKRIDRLCEIINGVAKNEIRSKFYIAGDGDEKSYLLDYIEENELGNFVEFLGKINSCEIHEFWSQQDIMIMCSDYEGHSLTQYESMLDGAVPIVTDVSGAEDDIKNGVNGYIISLDREEDEIISDYISKIDYLFTNRDRLEEMSEAARKTILAKNTEQSVIDLWKDVLGNEG